jgi:hypothetical protein
MPFFISRARVVNERIYKAIFPIPAASFITIANGVAMALWNTSTHACVVQDAKAKGAMLNRGQE